MDTYTHYVEPALRYWPLAVAIVGSVVGIIALFLLIRFIANRRYLSRRDMVWLEITPPSNIAKTPQATEQLFSVLHGARAARHLKEMLYNRSPVMSFEIASTRNDGIRYLLQVERSRSANVQKTVTSYIPDSKVKEIKRQSTDVDSVIEFQEVGHYVLPLTLTSIFEQHDPLGYVTGAMTQLADDEEITLQLVATPVRLREADSLSHKILGNENILQQVSNKHFSLLGQFANMTSSLASGVIDAAGDVYMDSHSRRNEAYSRVGQTRTTTHDRPSRVLSAFELELMETMHQKVTQPLFQVNMRVLVKSPEASVHISALRSALDGYSVPPYQALKTKINFPVVKALRRRAAIRRMPSIMRRSTVILAASELASLYHFPSSQVSKTDNLITSLSRTLPAPISLKQNKRFEVILGENEHHGVTTPIGLTEQERERHEYIIGGTGSGKTTMLQYEIVQDIQSGKGVAVVDPHGDMAETLLRYVPSERVKDVIYFNPDDLTYPIGLNLLELDEKLEGDELLREKDLITETVVSVFRKIFSDDDSGGHRIEYMLRNAVQTALTQEKATLFTVYDLINDPTYRKKVVATLTDENLKHFWRNEFGKAGGMQQVKMVAGITAKIGRFLFSVSAKRILEQEKSTIDFDDIIASSKILICNFSKGLLGEDTSELLGIMAIAKLQLASLRRVRIQQSERTPYYLYVDEFQNFATMSFVQMLSESRKYKLFLTMAEQSTSQQDDQRMVNIILANVGTVVCFRTGNPADEQALLQMFSPYIEQGEIANLPTFNYYIRIAAIQSQEPLSGRTLLLNDKDISDISVREAIIDSSRKNYAIKYTPKEVKLVNVKQSPTKKKKAPVKKTAAASSHHRKLPGEA
jgi:hypothetical protein